MHMWRHVSTHTLSHVNTVCSPSHIYICSLPPYPHTLHTLNLVLHICLPYALNTLVHTLIQAHSLCRFTHPYSHSQSLYTLPILSVLTHIKTHALTLPIYAHTLIHSHPLHSHKHLDIPIQTHYTHTHPRKQIKSLIQLFPHIVI